MTSKVAKLFLLIAFGLGASLCGHRSEDSESGQDQVPKDWDGHSDWEGSEWIVE